jgi:outer membrane protein assembly factor BamB
MPARPVLVLVVSLCLLTHVKGSVAATARAASTTRQSRSGAATPHAAVAMFRGDAAHTGVYAPSSADSFGGIAWRVPTGGAIRSTPVVAGGVLYVGSSDGVLYALDAATGHERWRFDAGSSISSSPAVANGLVYVGTRDARCLALRAANGTLAWTAPLGPDRPMGRGYETVDVYVSSPTPYENLVLIGGGDGAMHALDATTGHVRWSAMTEGRVRSSAAVSGGVAYFGSYDGCLYAVDARTGARRWRFETLGHGLRSEDFGYDRTCIVSSPAVMGDGVFVGARDGLLYGVGAADGALRWKVDHQPFWVISSPALMNGKVYAGSSDGRYVAAVDAVTGKEVWSFTTPGNIFGSPAISGGALFIGDWADNLLALDAVTGRELWRYRTSARIMSSPVVANDRVYFGCDDGAVYSLRLTHGPSPCRAVFWDSTFVNRSSRLGQEDLRTYLGNRGYRVVDATAVARFMSDRIQDRAPSVVVFAMDYVPPTLSRADGQPPLLRRYLDAGGKVVWNGLPPGFFHDLPDTARDLKTLDRAAPEQLIGVNYERSQANGLPARPTEEGRAWGLIAWPTPQWDADPTTVTTVLARDEDGLAAAWVRRFGGPPGTGFVHLPLLFGAMNHPANLPAIHAAAEYFPEERPRGN